jgi:hypothetical protein
VVECFGRLVFGVLSFGVFGQVHGLFGCEWRCYVAFVSNGAAAACWDVGMMDKELKELVEQTDKALRLVVDVLDLMIPKVEAMELRLKALEDR